MDLTTLNRITRILIEVAPANTETRVTSAHESIYIQGAHVDHVAPNDLIRLNELGCEWSDCGDFWSVDT